MANQRVKTRIQNKHDFEINWVQATFPPFAGEIIVYDRETDAEGNICTTKIGGVDTPVVPVTLADGSVRAEAYTYARFKIGDGITPVNDLPFAQDNIDLSEYALKSEIPNVNDFITNIPEEYVTEEELDSAIDSLISCGATDPTSTTTSQFYFKYNN